MIYELSKPFDANKAMTWLKNAIEKGKVVDMTEKRKKRTLSQNSYMHVIFDLFALEFGYTKKEAKDLLKRKCIELMRYEKNGEEFFRGTSDLSKDEGQVFIDWVLTFAAMQGCYIPSSEEYLQNQFEIDKEISRNKIYL